MTLSERQRHDAYEALTDAFAERTDLVIEMLRPATDLATTIDVESARRDVQQEIDEVRQEVRAFRGDVTHEFATVRHELTQMESRLTLLFERRLDEAFAAQTRTLVLGLVGAFMLTALTNVLTVVLR